MNLTELGLLGSLLLASHEGGHQTSASRLNVPIRWDKTKWEAQTDDNKKLAEIGGAGFQAQDVIDRALNKKDYSLLNALHKLSYLVSDRGDIKTMEDASGNKKVSLLLLASLLADVYKSKKPDSNWDVSFSTLGQGAPGLLYTRNF